MPYKTGKLKGELTTPEIRKLIKAHNVLVSITIPKGSKREDIMKILKNNGYMVDHEKQALVPKVKMKRKPTIDLKKATRALPTPKTKEEKAAAKKVRDKKKEVKETEAFKKRDAQVKALAKVVAKRKKGEIKKPDNTASSFKTIKQVEKAFDKALNKFKKENVDKFVEQLKTMTDIKKIKEEQKKLRQLGRKNVLDILEANEDLLEEDEEKYDALDSRFENVFNEAFEKVTEKIKELKKK